jgi:hypothetical protein
MLNGILNARLPKSERKRNPTQLGDLSLAIAMRKQSKGSRMNASTMKTIAYRLPRASNISSGRKRTEYMNIPFTPKKPKIEATHNTILCCFFRIINYF